MADLGWMFPMGAESQFMRMQEREIREDKALEEQINFSREELLNAIKQGKTLYAFSRNTDPVALVCDYLDGELHATVKAAIQSTSDEDIGRAFKLILNQAIEKATTALAENQLGF
jgi:hypothetical protein